MNGSLTTQQWLEATQTHYLREYLPGGGSSVKFAVCYPGVDSGELARQLRARAQSRGFLVADVDSAVIKLHMMEHFFGRIAEQIPWSVLAEKTLARFARANYWQVPEDFTSAGIVEQLEAANHLGLQTISLELQRKIAAEILADRRMAKDFRVAMYWLARARLDSGAEAEMIYRAITDWLGGKIRAISELKRYQIFTKVNRANARHLLGSLLVWIRDAGYAGLVVLVDARRLLEKTRAADGTLNYTKAALMDAYEVFRQFIDSTDELSGFFLTIFMPREFTELDPKSRGLGAYSALLSRVYDEVRDRHLANPLTALVRISETGELSA